MSSKFDALGLEVEKPVRMTIAHPVTGGQILQLDPDTGKPVQGSEAAWIDLYSTDSLIARNLDRENVRKRLTPGARVDEETPELIERRNTEYFASLVGGWNLIGLDGRPLDVPFSFDNAVEALSAPALRWLRDWVAQQANSRANFVKPLSKK